jgi:sterol desaturase/sphingolipid hydroxylase (fatty acid hydroxylase superfamily)
MTPIAIVIRGTQRTFDRATRSSVNYRLVPIVDVAGAAVLLIAGLRSDLPLPAQAASLAAGLALWPPIEYALHRWLGHGPASLPRRSHAMHHSDEDAPIAAPMFVVLAHVAVIWAGLALVIPAAAAALVAAGIYAGYNYYTLVHHALHHCEALVRRMGGGRMIERHRIHHRDHDVNFGVTSAVCDRLWGTLGDGRSKLRPYDAVADFSRTIKS